MKTYDKQGGEALVKFFEESDPQSSVFVTLVGKTRGVAKESIKYWLDTTGCIDRMYRFKNCHWGMADATPDDSKANLFIDFERI